MLVRSKIEIEPTTDLSPFRLSKLAVLAQKWAKTEN
jgi:hypothetical protein